MTTYNAMRTLSADAGYKSGDVLVLCGELFGRGYANGLVEQARRKGMTIIGTTVGRRESDGALRALNQDELTAAEELLGGKIINIPIEAGFDMEPANDGRSPIDQLKGVRPDDWPKVRLDWDAIEQSRQRGIMRFKESMAAVATEIGKLIPDGANVLFAHIIGGGMMRARAYMPVFNRVFKGKGERFTSSGLFWGSEMGQLCKLSFDEVTADTFRYLIEGTNSLRDKIVEQSGRVAYSAYGYHGCEVLVSGEYRWQSYTPYIPGWAKIRLEEIAADACQKGITAAVFNSPEIQTNSSALFMGVEISLYPLLTALEREGGGSAAEGVKEECRLLLRDDGSLEKLLKTANDYLASSAIAPFGDYNTWPHHNTPEQMELMIKCSATLMEMCKNPKEIVCATLSWVVVSAVGRIIIDTMWQPVAPVYWLNHDIVAKRFNTLYLHHKD